MGSEDVEVQCHQPQAPVSDSCDSSTAVGIATIPYQLADPPPMSVAPSQAATPTPVTGGGAILAQSAAAHTPPQNAGVQPSVPPSPIPHVQVIQQPLQNQYLQHLYAPQQQHMFLPSNLTIQPAIQGLAGAPGLSLQLQGKTIDNKTGGPAIISASPMQPAGNFSGPNLMPAGGQMITAGAKTCVQGQMLTASSKSTAVLQGQSTFIPSTTANQTVVIGPLGVLANQPSLIPHQAKAIADSQNKKSFLISQPATLHPKSPILPTPNAACGAAGQMVVNNQLKQIPSAPHIVSSQAPTMIASQAQILGSLQALGASLPQGITWATPGSLHSPALFGQNPIFIRSQQSDMFIQTPPPQATIHAVPVAAAAAPAPAPATTVTSAPAATAVPQSTATVAPAPKLKPVRPASSVATQTTVSTSASTSPHTSVTKTQAKQRTRTQPLRASPALAGGSPVTQHQTTATQTQTHPPSGHKADAANQTRLSHENKQLSFHSKSSSTETAFSSPELKPEKIIMTQEVRPTIASPLPSTNVAATSTVDIPVAADPPTPEAEVTCMDVEEPPNEPIPSEEPKEKKAESEPVVAVAPLPETLIKEPVKQPQKAIVKPHVLTHVIEGFVIQEGSEPFPVSRPLMSNSASTKSPASERTSAVSPVVTSPAVDVPVTPKKKEKIPKVRGPVELAKCEFCGKLGPKSKFKRSKRFCSTSCAKRYNSGCSKRHALSSDSEFKNSVSGKSAKKKKLGFKSKKSWKKSQNRSYEITNWVPPPELPAAEDVDFTNAEERKENNVQDIDSKIGDLPTNIEAESTLPPPSCQVEEIEKEVECHSHDFTTKSPYKWTVTDVFDFVRNLPGCSDYADEFRSQEIDGQALLLLKEDHLMSTMSMKLGPALKMCAKINSLRDEVGH